jgi:YVTN family beta-propeller protein
MMRSERRLAIRFTLLISLLITLAALSAQLRADTGSCGGESVTLPFNDVMSSAFFCQIAAAYFSGLTNGTTATTYSPGNVVTREQMATFITRTQDQALRRGSRRAALGQWWTQQGYTLFLQATVVGESGAHDDPQFITADGQDLWVANTARNTVTRVRASNGEMLANYTNVTAPQSLVAAAGAIYIACATIPGQLRFIIPRPFAGNPTPPASLVADNLGSVSVGLTYDGFYFWTANFGAGPFTGGSSISRVNPSLVNATTTFTAGFNVPIGILYDGANLWVTDQGDDSLKRVDTATGAILQSIPVGADPVHPVFDGTNLWVPNLNSNSISVVRAVGALRGTVLQTLTGNGLNGPRSMAFDGERIIVTNLFGNSVSLWKAADLTPIGNFSTGAGSFPSGACSDGINFWIVLQQQDSILRF